MLLKDRTTKQLVKFLENYDLSLTSFDVKGEAFEYFLGETFTGGLGEYFTPRNVVEFMVEATDPKIGEKLVDPFCGTGGFLIYAFETVSTRFGSMSSPQTRRASGAYAFRTSLSSALIGKNAPPKPAR